MNTPRSFRIALASTALVGILVSCTAGCSADAAEPPASSTESAMHARSLGTCQLQAIASGLEVGAVTAFGATEVCGAGLAVTGAGEVICLAPASAAGAAAIAALLTATVGNLVCSALSTRVTVSSSTWSGHDNQGCPDGTRRMFDDAVDRWCHQSRACDKRQTCDVWIDHVRSGSQCVGFRKKREEVCFPGRTDPGHQTAIEEAQAALTNCQRIMAGYGCL